MEKSLEKVYLEIFGTGDSTSNISDNDSLVQPAWGKVVESFTTSFSTGEMPFRAQLESDNKRD